MNQDDFSVPVRRVSLIAVRECFTKTRAREIAQLIKYLSCTGSEFSPWELHYRKGIVICPCNPGAGEEETGGSLSSQVSQLSLE